MNETLLDFFTHQSNCSYRGEVYLVRDNGAVLRKRRVSKRLRPLDEHWTFGMPCARQGYLRVSSEPVHRIVATAFHGAAPTQAHVVDHIDTNRRNNRPENLRWVTRLENILMNPITAKRIAFAYGSIEQFLANPAQQVRGGLGPNTAWMRTVAPQEARASYERLISWARSDCGSAGGTLGEWIYGKGKQERTEQFQSAALTQSSTPWAVQRRWKTASEYPHCPHEASLPGLADYCVKLRKGEVFALNAYGGKSTVVSASLAQGKEALLVHTHQGEDAPKKWALAKVTVENSRFVHESLGTFFTLDGAQKEFTLGQGLTWTGGDTFDDYC